ncbi:ribosome biogenesis GTPase Der [bacterium]|nr:MAG: ribosome biogenesis GTPase Der [bacterium]
MKPIIAIVGRPNVGKSTLFNKMLGKKRAIVHDEPGVTRDLNYAEAEERGHFFTLVDTGGFEEHPGDTILEQVRQETRLAIEEADVIIFVLDAKAGLTAGDIDIADMLRRSGKPIIYVANKTDSQRQEAASAELYGLGADEIMPVSAESGMGVSELLEAAIERLPRATAEEEDAQRIRVAIVGRPNVGKSSILNRLIGKKRSLVSSVAGTTRDPVDAAFDVGNRKYLFVDTAGIRKKDKVSLIVESYSVMAAIKAIDRCDAAVLVVDAGDGLTTQDEKIAGLIEARGKCCVIAVNKWDTVEKDTNKSLRMTEDIYMKAPFISYAPVLFMSAVTGQRAVKILEMVDTVVDKSSEKISTSKLNKVLADITSASSPPAYKGKEVKFYYVTQTGTRPPVFTVFSNCPEGVKDAYKRYMINRLRELLGLDNCPIRLFFRQRH